MATVLVVIGTRPEGIKLAPVIEALRRRPAGVETRVALTGQHGDMMDQVLDVFGIPVDWDLGVMREGQDLYDVTAACLAGLRGVVRECRPDLVLVQGDTASVFVAGLVGFFEGTRVGHVEAGLRSRDKWRPWPEEIFRRLTGVVADLHFAPTPRARDNLLAENVPAAAIHVTGNPVVDALRGVAARLGPAHDAQLAAALGGGRSLMLVTAHRRESFGEPLRLALTALRTVVERVADVEMLYPVHPNPNVRAAAEAVLSGHPRIRLAAPLDYHDLVLALRECALVVTDSGGLQEEAPTFGKPVLVMREVTERPEGVEAGIARLVGTDPAVIVPLAERILLGGGWRLVRALRTLEEAGEPADIATAAAAAGAGGAGGSVGEFPNPYGDGLAAERIADITVAALTGERRRTVDWTGVA